MNKITKDQFTKSAVWKLIETFTSKFVTFFISIILARLLMPEDYGIIAITAVFLSLSDIFIQGGFNTALIRKEDVDDEDYATSLIFSVIMASILYVIIYFSAPIIANFYDKDILVDVLRVIGVVLFFQAFASIQLAKITRDLKFKLLAKLTLIACFISGVLGIIMAYLGLGVWAIVIQQIAHQTILNLLMFIKLKFRFKVKWSSTKFKEMISFSFFVFLSAFIYYLGDNITNIVVGKAFSIEILGYLNKGDQIPRQVSVYTFSALSSVMLSAFASRQGNHKELKEIVRKTVRMSTFIIMPMMFGLYASAETTIIVLFSDKWVNSIEIQKWSAIYYCTFPITAIFIQVLYSLKESKKRVSLEIIRLILMLSGLYMIINIFGGSIYELMIYRAIASIVVMIIAIKMIAKLINYSFIETVSDIIPYVIGAIVMGSIVYVINFIKVTYVMKLLIQVIIGVFVYFVISKKSKWKELDEILIFLKKFNIRRRG
ncbi:MAG: lipopolysaccharide biosynthesis protein [Clostridia bacterium]|nr:lipopolysaccharide biosynthesis protein [Clostridia bacterium]